MSLYDLQFIDNLKQIMNQEWEVDNRATWQDGSPVATKRILHVVNKYDLSVEFPASTLKPTTLKSCFMEDDWIYRKQSSNVNDLGIHIWDAWADETGSIGTAYGSQVAKPVFGYDNQMEYILNEIKKNPTSRRLIIELWNVNELHQMNLVPCCHHLNFSVKNGKLHLFLKQRSQDTLVANNFNVVQYALLMHMIARHCGLDVGVLTHAVVDMHIYNKHEQQALELLSRPIYSAPTLWINPDVNNFYDFSVNDFKLLNYQKGDSMKFEVAI
jgi:thymidylate synthase